MYKKSLPPNCVFPKLNHEKKKKVHEKGFVIARIPS
jgi:hypothetical protein